MSISRNEIIALLNQDSYYRKVKEWPLLTTYEILKHKQRIIKSNDVFCIPYISPFNSPKKIKTDVIKFRDHINEYFPFTNELLNKFKGHLVACGGAITKTLIGRLYNLDCDIDFFFYNLTIEEANELRLEVINFLIEQFTLKHREYVKFYVQRNVYVTTLYVALYDNLNDRYYEHVYEYQFIHRIYPSIDSILGGFDLACCSIAYDGENLFSTPLGTWSIQHTSVIVDLQRRSTSYETRLKKYFRNGFTLILPGLTEQIFNKYLVDPINDKYKEFIGKIVKLCEEYDYRFEEEHFIKSTKHYSIQVPEYYHTHACSENILPPFKLKKYDTQFYLTTKAYDRKNVENRLTDKISDYDHITWMANFNNYLPHINLSRLRLNKLHSVVSILEIIHNDNIMRKLVHDVDHPNLHFNEDTINYYKQQVDKVKLITTMNITIILEY